jgi:hypothetical protein
MTQLLSRIRNYFEARKKEKRALYIARYSFDQLDFGFIHRPIDHPKYTYQAEFALHPDITEHDPLAGFFETRSQALAIYTESKARQFFTGLGLIEDKDFFVGTYVTGELFYHGVLMIQVKDPKWIMMFKLVFES